MNRPTWNEVQRESELARLLEALGLRLRALNAEAEVLFGKARPKAERLFETVATVRLSFAAGHMDYDTAVGWYRPALEESHIIAAEHVRDVRARLLQHRGD